MWKVQYLILTNKNSFYWDHVITKWRTVFVSFRHIWCKTNSEINFVNSMYYQCWSGMFVKVLKSLLWPLRNIHILYCLHGSLVTWEVVTAKIILIFTCIWLNMSYGCAATAGMLTRGGKIGPWSLCMLCLQNETLCRKINIPPVCRCMQPIPVDGAGAVAQGMLLWWFGL